MSALSLDEIEVLLGEAKTRGEYKPVLGTFFDSGDVYLNLSERFPGKVAQSLRNAVNIRLKQDFQDRNFKLMIVNEKDDEGNEVEDGEQSVLLVNMDAYLAARAAMASNES